MSVKVKANLETKEVISYLENILDGLKKNKVVVQLGDEYVTFEPENEMKFELKAESKENKGKLDFSLSYKKAVEETPEEEAKISIGSKEPEIKVEGPAAEPAKKPAPKKPAAAN